MEDVSISSSESKFLDFLIEFISEKNPRNLFTNLDKISKYMLDEMPPKCDENLY